MGFLDNLANGLNKFNDSMADMMEKKMAQAERDYDAGRISFEEYSKIFQSYSDFMRNYTKTK